MAGRGRQAGPLLALARKHRVVRAIDFVGHLPDKDLVARLAAADVVVLPSRYEPFGIVALETAAVGAPLVAASTGGLSELVIDGESGLAFPPGDVDALAQAVRAVLDDPVAADRRARRAKARLREDFDWHKIAAATAEIYRTAELADHPDLGRPKIASGNAFTA
jgi:glycogen(starch) synthase